MQLLKSFLSFLRYERRYSEHTIDAYHTDLMQCRAFIRDHFDHSDWEHIDGKQLRSWLVSLSQKGLEPRTINRKISSLSSFYSFLNSRNKIDNNPTLKLTGLKTKQRLPKTLPEDDRQWDLPDYNQLSFEALRDYLVVFLLIQTGMRRSELIGLKHRNVNISVANAHIQLLGKGKKERLVPIHNRLVQMIAHYISLKNDHFDRGNTEESPLIVTDKGKKTYPKFIYRTVKRFLQSETTLRQKSPHVLRHTFATKLANQGADLNAIKSILGHSSLAATQIYTHTTIDRLKNVYKQAHPKGEN